MKNEKKKEYHLIGDLLRPGEAIFDNLQVPLILIELCVC